MIGTVGTFLQAIANVQHVADEIQERETHEVFIRSISQNSPIGVSLEGVSDALRLLLEVFDKHKRQHTTKMEEYVLAEKRLELEKKRLEHQEMRLHLERQVEELRKLRIENAKAELALQKDVAATTIEIIEKIASERSMNEKLAYGMKLVKPIDILMSSGLAITFRERKSEEA